MSFVPGGMVRLLLEVGAGIEAPSVIIELYRRPNRHEKDHCPGDRPRFDRAGARPRGRSRPTGTIAGRIVDAQGAVMPGVTVTGKNIATGFTRSEVTDATGSYRLAALPVGTYDLTAELQGFNRVENKGIVVNVGQTLEVAMTLKLATVSEDGHGRPAHRR